MGLLSPCGIPATVLGAWVNLGAENLLEDTDPQAETYSCQICVMHSDKATLRGTKERAANPAWGGSSGRKTGRAGTRPPSPLGCYCAMWELGVDVEGGGVGQELD